MPLPDPKHLEDDLRGLIKGEYLGDDLSRDLYATDASIFEVRPLGIVTPRDEEDVCALVRYAAEHGVPLIPRGAGTGLAGESLGEGLIVDLSRHMRSILDIGVDTVRVQPGVVLRRLSAVLAESGRRFAPDPANLECTIGGMLATNASGARAILHGYTRDHVKELRVVLDSGEAVAVGRELTQPNANVERTARLQEILAGAASLLEAQAGAIEKCWPRTQFNRCGYHLPGVLADRRLDLPRLLVGSEGTLGFFTEATLRTIPLPAGQAVVVLAYHRLDAALAAVQTTLELRPASCDLLDRRLLALARHVSPLSLPGATEAVLIVEFEADSTADAVDRAQTLSDRLLRASIPPLQSRIAGEAEELESVGRMREAVVPGLYGIRGPSQAIAFVEDVGVPPVLLANYLDGVQRILQQHETSATFLIHAAAGQVHMRPFLNLGQQPDVARMRAIAEDVHGLAIDLGGTVSSQHGTGLARTPWVARQYGPLYSVMRAIKALFDPRNIFNPGKIIAEPSEREGWPLRRGYVAEAASKPIPSEPASILPHPALTAINGHALPALFWSEGEPRSESERCNGCGHCRTESPTSRMCPIFRASPIEAATPRAKANLVRHLLQSETDGQQLSSDEARAVADLCVNCKMCAVECPARVQIPRLMLEAKAANVAQHGLNRTDWVLARTESFAWIGSALAPLVNAFLRNRGVRWVLERLFGVSRLRRLPSFSFRSFMQRASRRGWTRPPRSSKPDAPPRVAYFVDIFANYNDPSIAEAVVAVLQHNGVEVYVPPRQMGCGMAPLACGDVETAREIVRRNHRLLADLVRQGYTILCAEPTAALMLRQDALDLVKDREERADAELVAKHTVEFTSFLWELLQKERLRLDFNRLEASIGHHVPCHLKALGDVARGPALLSLIPGLRVRTIDVSCSGMAGTFGLKAENYEVSLAAGKPMLDELRRPSVLFGATECSTCRLQMEDGARKRTLHPAQYLALAYGLMPELARKLHEPIEELLLG